MDVILVGLLNLYLKDLYEIKRPYPYQNDNGMPSGHAQVLTYILLAYNLPIVIQIIMIYKIFLRFYYGYHTIFQIFMGCLTGIFCYLL